MPGTQPAAATAARSPETGASSSAGARTVPSAGAGALLAAAVVLAALLAPATAPAQDASIADHLSGPHRSGLVAASDAAVVAWVENRSGVRNVRTAAAPGWEARRITSFAEDDGRTIRSLRLTPDGSAVVFTRGDARNRHGEFPNPTSLVAEPEQRIRVVPTDGGPGRIVGPGSGPALSPDGERFVFRRDGKAWIAPTDGSAGPVVLFAARKGAGELTWSPDGTRIAFISDRGHHAFLGVVDVPPGIPAPAEERAGEGARVRWISPSVDRDAGPAWSPDGSRIAFLRFPDLPPDRARWIFGNVSEPFSVMVADVATGEARAVWRSPRDGTNRGYPRVSGSHPLMWAGSDRLLFPGELDGYLHIYAVDAGGGEATDLTPGACIVEDATVGPGGGWLYFNHNCAGIDRRQISRVRTSGGEPRLLVGGDHGIAWSPTPVGDGSVLAFVGSSWRHPGVVHRMPADGGEASPVGEPVPEGFPADGLVRPEKVVFTTPDGLEIHGQLFLPEGAREAGADDPRPAMIYMHGGSRRQMLLGFHYSGYYQNAYAFNQYLASRGYVVLSVNYRSGIGYGKAFRQPPHYGWQGASEYRDIRAAARWLAGEPYVDGGRIGLWGGSYGGYLTALGLARDSDVFAAGVDLHGVHDWVETLRFWGSDLFDPEGTEAADSLAQLALRSSPNAYADEWRSPVLLIHGDDDRNVDFRETVALVDLLRANGEVEFEQLVFPDDVHGFLLHSSWLAAFRRADAFLERHLRP